MAYVQAAIAAAQFASQLFGQSSRAKFQKRAAQLANRLRNEHLMNVTAPQFDLRTGFTRTGNDEQYRLSEEGSGLIDDELRDTFDDVSEESNQSFDEQLGIRTGLREDQYNFTNEMIDAFRTARVNNTARYQVAQAEQDAYQAAADNLADAFTTLRGTAAFEAQRMTAEADRNLLLDDTLSAGDTGLPTPPGQNQGLIEQAFADQQARGINTARDEGVAANRIASAGDALLAQERGLKSFAEDIDAIGRDARLKAAPLGAQNYAENLRAGNRADSAQGRLDIEETMAEELAASLSDYRGARIGARQGFGDQEVDSIGSFYDRDIGSVADFTNSRNNASRQFEQGMDGLLNFKIGSIGQGQNPGGGWDLLSAGLNAMSGMNFSSVFKGRPTVPTKPGASAPMLGSNYRGAAPFDDSLAGLPYIFGGRGR